MRTMIERQALQEFLIEQLMIYSDHRPLSDLLVAALMQSQSIDKIKRELEVLTHGMMSQGDDGALQPLIKFSHQLNTYDEEGQIHKTSLLLEPIYPVGLPEELKARFIDMAKEKAKALQVPLYSGLNGIKESDPLARLFSLANSAGIDYSDSGPRLTTEAFDLVVPRIWSPYHT